MDFTYIVTVIAFFLPDKGHEAADLQKRVFVFIVIWYNSLNFVTIAFVHTVTE